MFTERELDKLIHVLAINKGTGRTTILSKMLQQEHCFLIVDHPLVRGLFPKEIQDQMIPLSAVDSCYGVSSPVFLDHMLVENLVRDDLVKTKELERLKALVAEIRIRVGED